MTLARHNPLAPGVYWTDIFSPARALGSTATDQLPTFLEWVKGSPGVHILRTEHDDNASPIKRPGGAVVRTWFSFEVDPSASPLPYSFRQLGFPTIIRLRTAPGGVTDRDRQTTSDDTAQNTPTTFDDVLSNAASSLANALTADYRPLVLVGLGLWLYSQFKRRR